MATTRHAQHSVLGKIGDSFEGGGIGEEKKSFDEEENENSAVIPGGESLLGGTEVEGNSATEQDDPRLSKFEELEELRGRVFESEDELLEALEELKLDDRRVILGDDGKAYLFMKSDNHNGATTEIAFDFNRWDSDRKGFATGDQNIYLDQAIPVPPPKKQRRLREPDISFWGEPRCERRNNKLRPRRLNPLSKFPWLTPDVVIQFSWKNTWAYEVEALNDMMNRSDTSGNNTAPRVGYLIKVRFAPEVPGLDVYKVPHKCTFEDAKNNRSGAKHEAYNVGGNDIVIKITTSDLGISTVGIWGRIRGMFYGDFEYSMKELYEEVV
jgi:hypothetical protein